MDPTQLQPGHKLDRYELLCPLAYGGMASVWLARFQGTSRRRGFERLVVVKMILPQYAQDPRFQEMFLDEARIASKIEHANVARILDVGEHADSTFIVMEWIDGDSLSKVLRAAEQKKQLVPAGVALRICADAAGGLHAAHILQERDGTSLGVVHRDVSPQNILVSNNGTTVIIDFGVAKARDRVSQDTSAGQLKGKIRYMAPEQALGKDLDHRADIWAIGAILYELFAGRAPFDAPNEIAMINALTRGVAPDPLPETVPEPVRAVAARALSYDPSGRYATALELNLALESAMVELGELTAVAAVANYTAQLLADRKQARRRAVDDALAEAAAREADRGSAGPPAVVTPPPPSGASAPGAGIASVSSTSSFAMPAAPPADVDHTAHLAPQASTAALGSLAPIAQPFSYPPASPSGSSGLGFGESPSAASATLGSTSLEYRPDEGARSRRFVTAAVLTVSVLAGAAGIALIISAAVMRREPRAQSAGLGAAANAAASAATVPEPAPAPSAPVPSAEPNALASASSPVFPPAPPPAPSLAPARRTFAPPVRPRPPAAPPAPAVPAAPPTAPSKPDRGF